MVGADQRAQKAACDTEAAKAYRLAEAGMLIRRYKVRYVNRDEDEVKIPALVNVAVSADDESTRIRVYMPIGRVLESPELTGEMLANARQGLVSWRRKFSVLQEISEFSGVISAIDGFLGQSS